MPVVDPYAWARLIFDDRNAWTDFLGAHSLWHTALDAVVRRAGGAPYATLPLGIAPRSVWLLGEPTEPPAAGAFYPDGDWHEAHQARHEGEAVSLGIASPPDFRSYELSDADEFATWAFLHALEHVRLQGAAGL